MILSSERESRSCLLAKSLQSCPTLCDPTDGSPPGSPVPGILQERTLEWVAISFSNAWKWKVKVKLLSCVRLLATPWTAAHQAPPSTGFSRQEYWSGVPLPSLLKNIEGDKWINTMWYIHTMEYDSAKEREEILIQAGWLKLQTFTFSQFCRQEIHDQGNKDLVSCESPLPGL